MFSTRSHPSSMHAPSSCLQPFQTHSYCFPVHRCTHTYLGIPLLHTHIPQSYTLLSLLHTQTHMLSLECTCKFISKHTADPWSAIPWVHTEAQKNTYTSKPTCRTQKTKNSAHWSSTNPLKLSTAEPTAPQIGKQEWGEGRRGLSPGPAYPVPWSPAR